MRQNKKPMKEKAENMPFRELMRGRAKDKGVAKGWEEGWEI